jgi:azurin
VNTRAAAALVACLTLAGGAPAAAAGQDDGTPPRILLDQSPRAVEYQLARLSDAQLARVERHADDPRYVPVYQAILRRSSLDEALRDEALSALVAFRSTTAVRVLLDALAGATEVDQAGPLLRKLASLPAAELATDTAAADAVIDAAAVDADAPVVRGAWIVQAGARGAGPALLSRAAGRRQRVALFDALADLARAADPRVGGTAAAAPPDLALFVPHVHETAFDEADVDVRAAAIRALGALVPDTTILEGLADIAANAPDIAVMVAIVDAAAALPRSAWTGGRVESLARAIVGWVSRLGPAERTGPAAIDAIALADALAGRAPPAAAAALRADLRTLGVRVVRLSTVFEQVAFDTRWFVVEAGRPVQIVFFNPDAMPHNVVIGTPGSLEAIGTAGGAMPLPDDPSTKPFVPDMPEVLAATELINQDETARLSFTAPDEPGDYVFVCTFPGHWVRMYGVMKVVADLAVWETRPDVPADPLTGKPFD